MDVFRNVSNDLVSVGADRVLSSGVRAHPDSGRKTSGGERGAGSGGEERGGGARGKGDEGAAGEGSSGRGEGAETEHIATLREKRDKQNYRGKDRVVATQTPVLSLTSSRAFPESYTLKTSVQWTSMQKKPGSQTPP